MRRNGEMICKLGGGNFRSGFSELRDEASAPGIDKGRGGRSWSLSRVPRFGTVAAEIRATLRLERGVPSGDEALGALRGGLAARLKPCPDTKQKATAVDHAAVRHPENMKIRPMCTNVRARTPTRQPARRPALLVHRYFQGRSFAPLRMTALFEVVFAMPGCAWIRGQR